MQTFLAFFVVFWWDRRNRIQDKKEERRKEKACKEEKRRKEWADREDERRKEEANRKRADLKNILALLISENYDKVQEIFQDLKKSVDNLKEGRQINTGSRTFTEYDVLLYMCHVDNRNRFNQYASLRNELDRVSKIMKFFTDFSFYLSAIDNECPNDIKLRYSPEIIDMARIIYPFVIRTEQELIEKVLIYFGCANEGLVLYPGHDEIKQAIPYIEYLLYDPSNKICCRITYGASYNGIMPRIMEIEAEIRDEIGELLKCTPQGDILHLIRLVLFKIRENNFDIQEKQRFDNFPVFCETLFNEGREISFREVVSTSFSL
jgi:hypothetical protein